MSLLNPTLADIEAAILIKRRNKISMIFPDLGNYRRELYPKHLEFFQNGANFRIRAMRAANRVGKTTAGAFETTCHLTGNYPPWWNGRRFNHPIDALVAGETGKLVRDSIQAELMGKPGEIGTGMIPADCIIERRAKSGIPDAIDTVRIKHKFGESKLQFQAYDQGREAFQATTRHLIWLDEEPSLAIYGEAITRTMTTGGVVYLTFTPLKGISETVQFLQQQEQDGKIAIITATWDDAPHLSEKDKEDMLANYPPHQRDARSKGIPALGSGAIYPVPESEFLIAPINLPHHWPRAYAMDVGWNRCLAKDSMVMLPDGTEAPIQDLRIGDEVLAFDFASELLVPTKIVDTFVGFANNMVTLGISDYQTITCTDDHPFAHRGACKDPIVFKKIKDINKRIREFQSVVLPSKWVPKEVYDVCSPEMARIIGYLIGDGCLTYINRRLEFAQKIPEFIDDFHKCLKSVECRMSSYDHNSKHHLSGREHGKNAVLNFIREHGLLGTNSFTKFIPTVFFMATEDVVKNLLVGLIHTDGSVEGDNIRYYTVSKNLADGVKKLCLRLGIYASVSIDKRKRKITHKDVYRVTLRRPLCLPLLPPKQLKNVRPERKKRHDRLISKYEPVEPQDIYCITVDHPDHAFVCNGFVVSNTAALFGAYDRDADTIYFYSEHYRGMAEPSVHADAIKGRGIWMPGVIDPASRGRSQKDGEQLYMMYKELGLNITLADNSRETGIYEFYQRLSSMRIKVFNNLVNFINEYRIYRRDDKGNVVKENDHLMDCARYFVMSAIDIVAFPPEWTQKTWPQGPQHHQSNYDPFARDRVMADVGGRPKVDNYNPLDRKRF